MGRGRAVDEAELVLVRGQDALESGGHGLDPVDAPRAPGRFGQRGEDPGLGGVEHGLEEGVLRRKVPVEDRFGDAGRERELTGRRAREAPPGEEGEGGLEDLLAAPGRREPPGGGAGAGGAGRGEGVAGRRL